MRKDVVCLVTLVLFAIIPLFAERTLSVTGEAEIKVAPDEVAITVGIETVNENLLVSKQENDKKAKEIITLLRKNGIQEKYIKTDYINIEPRYDYYEKKKFLGYYVTKNIVITLKDLTKFETVLSDILIGGANYVHGIQFKTTELRKYRDQARLMAIKAAKEKAIALAGELGQKIGKPLSISENSSNYWFGYMRNERQMTQNVMQDTGSSAPTGEGFAPGMITVTANVSVVFELE